MAEIKKVPFSSVQDESVISMSFDENPNIPTANYSEETLVKINAVIAKKIRAEKIKKMIETELKAETKKEEDPFLAFNFNSM